MKRKRDKTDGPGFDLATLTHARELFWQNVMREMLTSLSMQRARLEARKPQPPRLGDGAEAANGQADDPQPIIDGFDGRMAVVTSQGERIPIADITPLFACSIGGTQRERALSEDVQCTVFQIRTPSGEVYTFPVQEIRGFHALTEQAMQALQAETASEEGGVPFGFAAFTSLARDLAAQEGGGGPTDAGDAEEASGKGG